MSNKRRDKQRNSNNLNLVDVYPLTERQEIMLNSKKNLCVHGCAGTGKSFLATYMGLRDILKFGLYNRLIYIRSAVPTRDMGFLPGTDKEKAEVYEAPYKEILAELLDRGDAYELAKRSGLVHFMTTSFLRGTTMRDAIVIVDETQNMSYHELDSIITRLGDNCRVFFCGDQFQADLDKPGIRNFYKVLKDMGEFDFLEFGLEDIVRGPLVKSYLETKHKIHGKQVV